jgi:hypothetical protein
MERRQKSSSHHDCTIATPPPRFNPVPCYDCCTAYTRELTTEALDKTFEVRVQKETTREKKWRSFKRLMNENQTVVWMKNRAWMTTVPSGTRPGPGALLPEPRPLTRPTHPMPWASADVMAWVHGLGGLAWCGGGPYSASGAARRDGSRGERPRTVPAWRGGRAVTERNLGEKKYHAGGTRLA